MKTNLMLYSKPYLLALVFLNFALSLQAHIGPTRPGQETNASNEVNFRNGCFNAVTQIDQQINNVRARLTTGGDMWWDGTDGRYIVPKVAPGTPEVSSIFASGLWIGGKDLGGNIKIAAQTYGRSAGNFDFYPGPLYEGSPTYPGGVYWDPSRGTIEPDTCAQWDKFFVVKGEDIDTHVRNWRAALEESQTKLDPENIPESILGWPARGNSFFTAIHQFDLPQTQQGLADFWDQDLDGMYEPEKGDYPILGIRYCMDNYPKASPDEMIFWIYNDTGNEHRNSGSARALQMEIQGLAFSFKTNDDFNNMTFQRHKLINRSIERLDSTYFGLWVDADLGCSTDDYIGCDIDRNLAYTYNADAVDGTEGCVCDAGMTTYCEEIPILGIDFFRGPRAPIYDGSLQIGEKELGITSFTYYNNALSDVPAGQAGPETAEEYYNLLSGKWKDGTPFTYGGNGYNTGGEEVSYVFSDPPNQVDGWSMCSEDVALGDRRTIQSSGPFTLLPGAVNEMIFGVIWVADQNYPCPSLDRLLRADDMAQNLFDGCIYPSRGPDAPAVDWIELDQEVVAVFSNDTLWSNNAFEGFNARGLDIPEGEDGLFRFEGYKLYPFSGPNISLDDVDDPEKARLVYQVDKKNGIGQIFNWEIVENNEHPLIPDLIYEPILKVDGTDEGIRHTFSIKEDQFAEGDHRLINHKKYYFTAVAYAYNNYKDFNPDTNEYAQGQQRPYWEGSRNVGDDENKYYTVIPRRILDRELYSTYGGGVPITCIDGVGTSRNFLDIADETRAEIEELVRAGDFESFSNEVTYKRGMAPIDVTIYNPLDVLDGEYELTFIDDEMDNDELDTPVYWTLRNLTNSTTPVLTSEQSIEALNEQVIAEYGFSVTVEQVNEPGSAPFEEANNGAIGYAEEYADPDANPWLFGVNDGLVINTGNPVLDGSMFNYAVISDIENDIENALDPNHALSSIGNGFFIPYYFCDWRAKQNEAPYLSPAWKNSGNQNSIVHNRTSLADLNNVDIVFTSDKTLWSRCVIIETATPDHREVINATPEDDYIVDPVNGGQSDMFDLRAHPSVSKEAGADGLPLSDENPLEGEEMGMGWFPGYAIDVETGQRLNIFFGENSAYNDKMPGSSGNGNDMMFNPSSEFYLLPVAGGDATILNYPAGGQHYIYVTDQPYDRCAEQLDRFGATSDIRKLAPLERVTWTGFIAVPSHLSGMASYADGLIPADVTVKLRVNNPYQVKSGTAEFNGYPTYRFALKKQQALPLDEIAIEKALQSINVIPNPYYGFSDYENSWAESVIKISNLPAKCTVTIYSLDGTFVRKYDRDEKPIGLNHRNRAINQTQIIPDIEWDLKNNRGLPIASGVYLIHISAPGLGERTLKWFGVNRQFDP